MKRTAISFALISAVLGAALPGFAQNVPQPAPLAAPAPAGAEAYAQAILQARDPSSAIQAYGVAQAAAPGDVRIEQAYVSRMVGFGLPEMADVQAQDVERRVPTDGVAWAVSAYMSVKRDQAEAGVSEISMAVRYAPDDTFVQRTAGQIVAWFDSRPNRASLPTDLQQALQTVRGNLNGKAIFAEAYSRATDEYKQIQAANPPASSSVAPVPGGQYNASPDVVLPESAPALAYNYGAYTSTVPVYAPYPEPFLYSSYTYSPYAYWYPTPCWTADYWWPSFFGTIVLDNDFRHHHRYDYDFDRGRRFDLRDRDFFNDRRFDGDRRYADWNRAGGDRHWSDGDRRWNDSDRRVIVGNNQTNDRNNVAVSSQTTNRTVNHNTTSVSPSGVTVTPARRAETASRSIYPQYSGTSQNGLRSNVVSLPTNRTSLPQPTQTRVTSTPRANVNVSRPLTTVRSVPAAPSITRSAPAIRVQTPSVSRPNQGVGGKLPTFSAPSGGARSSGNAGGHRK